MSIKNTPSHYGSVAKVLHWLIFLLLLVMIVGGFFMGDLPKEYKGTIYNLHKLTGVTILFLMLFRVLWTLTNVKPRLPAHMPSWQRFAMCFVQFGLYVLAISMPLVGWIGSSAVQKYPHIAGFHLKLPVPHERWIAGISFDFHTWIAYTIIGFASVHILAALYHQFILKDNLIRRMW